MKHVVIANSGSTVVGVRYHKPSKKWRAAIGQGPVTYHSDLTEAVRARWELELNGSYGFNPESSAWKYLIKKDGLWASERLTRYFKEQGR